jgi:hypothetical protein
MQQHQSLPQPNGTLTSTTGSVHVEDVQIRIKIILHYLSLMILRKESKRVANDCCFLLHQLSRHEWCEILQRLNVSARPTICMIQMHKFRLHMNSRPLRWCAKSRFVNLWVPITCSEKINHFLLRRYTSTFQQIPVKIKKIILWAKHSLTNDKPVSQANKRSTRPTELPLTRFSATNSPRTTAVDPHRPRQNIPRLGRAHHSQCTPAAHAHPTCKPASAVTPGPGPRRLTHPPATKAPRLRPRPPARRRAHAAPTRRRRRRREQAPTIARGSPLPRSRALLPLPSPSAPTKLDEGKGSVSRPPTTHPHPRRFPRASRLGEVARAPSATSVVAVSLLRF